MNVLKREELLDRLKNYLRGNIQREELKEWALKIDESFDNRIDEIMEVLRKIDNFYGNEIVSFVLDYAYVNENEPYLFGFDKQKALEFVDLFKKHNAYILGGDVLELKNEELRYTYDNWHSDPGEDDISKSFVKAKDYISKYPLEDRFFSFVWDDAKKSYSMVNKIIRVIRL